MAAEDEEAGLEPQVELEPEPELELEPVLEFGLELDGADEELEDLWAKLPDEVQQDIFKRLRWRSLFRVCVVCKSFNEGINRYVHQLPLFRTAVPISSE